MANDPHRDHAAVPQDGRIPALQPAAEVHEQPPASLDANGFDPTEFEWRPVPRRARKDGWSPEVQQRFIEALACYGIVDRACEEVGMSTRSAYRMRNAPGGEGFAAAWQAVLTKAADRVLDIAFEQATEGEEVPIFDADGVRTGSRRRYNTRMAMFLLRAYHPERFRHANKDTRQADEAPLPPTVPVAQAVASLAPVTPAAPHLLTPPHQLAWRIEDARAEAARLALDPPDEREPWRVPFASPQAPCVHERARRKQARRRRAEQREDERARHDLSVTFP